MPLTFSESKETQNQQVGLFEKIKEGEDCEMYTKTYNSYPKPNKQYSETKYEALSCLYCKSEDSALNTDEHELNKNPKPVYISDNTEDDLVMETTALKHISEPSYSSHDDSVGNDNYLTVSGTIKRGKKKGQSVEVILNMSREELEILEANIANKKRCFWNTKTGIGFPVLLWTVFCFPFAIIISGAYSFYMGTITWYNVFKFFSENDTICYKICLPPILIILYPFLITVVSLGVGVYAGIKQVSCFWDSWLKEFLDFEKGFYGWICNLLDMPECSPYEVVILSRVPKL